MSKIRIIEVSYSCFDGMKTKHKTFNNIIEGWRYYREHQDYQFTLGDEFYRVHATLIPSSCVRIEPQRPHARGREEWEEECAKREYLGFTREDADYLIALAMEDIYI